MAGRNNEDPYLALLNQRNIPRNKILGSPAQLPTSDTFLVPQVVDPKKVRKRLEHYRQLDLKCYDRTAKLLQP